MQSDTELLKRLYERVGERHGWWSRLRARGS